MPFYGYDHTYGSPLLYGQESVGLRWVLEVDWDGDGAFDGSSEFPNVVAVDIELGRDFKIPKDGNGFAKAKTGRITIKVNNHDGRYNPYNTSSPLYPNIVPGRLFRLRAVHENTPYAVVVGRVDDILPIGGMNSFANIVAVDGWQMLERNASVLIQENQDSDVFINLLLDDAAWPAIWGRDIGAGEETLPYWWADNESSEHALHSLANAELARIWIDGAGIFNFRARSFTPSYEASITDDDIDKEAGFTMPQPWDVVRNRITVRANPLLVQAGVTLWELQGAIAVPNGQSREIWVDYLYDNENVPAKNVITTPTDYTEFEANTTEDGLGTDLTTGFTNTVEPFSKRAKVTYLNSSGLDGFVLLSKVIGDAIANPYSQSLISESASSIALYGERDFVLDERWLQDVNLARNFSTFIRSILSTPRPYLDCWLLPNLILQLGMGIGKWYQLNLASLGLSGGFEVVHLEHHWKIENAADVATRVLFEPAVNLSSTSYMVFPYQFEINSDFAL